MLFNQLGLSAELLSAVEKQGYREATPVQREAIPPILEGRDILASAQTGTGKTAGFTLPLLQRLQASRPARRHVRALILVPTRELAAQVSESVRNYGCHLPIRSMQIYGGVSIRPQISRLREGVDIVVATPGRLLDHVQQKTIDLSSIEVLVLDEADRMLDMGFIRDIRKILKLIPAERQNLLFSATFSKEIRSLASSFLRSPAEIQVAPSNTTAARVSQLVHPVDKARKRELLSHRIGEENWRQVLVFTRTKHGANRLAQQLSNDGLHAVAIHGNKSQGARTKALKDFKSGKVRVLVATDIAARGLDIDKLPHVVNFELPHVPEDYVHRIGRTARAGLDGHAVSLVCVDEEKLLRDIERLMKRNIQKEHIPGDEPDPRIKAEPIRKGRPQIPKSRRNDPRKQRTGASNGHGGQHRGSSGRRKRA
jgi:ATP-dependent RNA helicase RhlE